MNDKPASEGALLLLGGSSDLALELLRALEPGGPPVLVHYRKSLKKVREVMSARKDLDIIPLQADLADVSQVEALVAEVRARCGAPDKIVHFAAPKARHIHFRNAAWGDFEAELAVQLRSVVMVLHEFLPAMAKRGKGKVVFMLSSYTVEPPPPAMAHYVTAKYALLGLMRSLAVEYGRHGIGIHAVSPTMMKTSFLDELSPRLVELLGGELLLAPRDVAVVLKRLLSDGSGAACGANIPLGVGSKEA